MLSKNPDYRELRKLRGRSTIGGASWTYWLGRDHVLIVEVSGYAERYRRFYFRDVQALAMSATRQRLWGRVGFGLFTCLLASFFSASALFSYNDGSTESVMWSVVVGLCLSVFPIWGLIQNELHGPGAQLTLITAVQALPLPGVNRWRRAELLLAELKPLIEAAQARAASVSAPAPAPEPSAAAEVSSSPTPATATDAPSPQT